MSSLTDKNRLSAKIDSRRFAKGIFCEILRGAETINMLKTYGLIPPSINLDLATGLDSKLLKLFAMPTYKYEEFQKLSKVTQSGTQEKLEDAETKKLPDVDSMQILLDANEKILTFLKQNIILVQVEEVVPEGIKAGLDPEYYGVLVETLDLNQSISGLYARKTKANVRKIESWNKKKDRNV